MHNTTPLPDPSSPSHGGCRNRCRRDPSHPDRVRAPATRGGVCLVVVRNGEPSSFEQLPDWVKQQIADGAVPDPPQRLIVTDELGDQLGPDDEHDTWCVYWPADPPPATEVAQP